MATANTNPATMSADMARKVEFTTTNVDFATLFSEAHIVTGPNGAFTVPLNTINIGGAKYVVPLTSNSAQGANYLKFHFPQFFLTTGNLSEFYVTFCQKNNNMADGYYDYQTGVPLDYNTDFRTFVLDNAQTLPQSLTTKKKTLVFSVYGADSNQPSEAEQFKVEFNAVFGTTSNNQLGNL